MKQLKKIVCAVVMLSMLASVCACGMKNDTEITVGKNGDVVVSSVLAYDDEMIDMSIESDEGSDSSSEITDEDRWAYIEENLMSEESLTYERFEDEENGWKGVRATSEDNKKSIDEFSVETEGDRVNIYGDDFVTSESALFVKSGKTYKSNMTANFSETETYSGIKDYLSYMTLEIKLVITLPSKAISSNADEVSEDGKTLTWDFSDLEDRDIDFEFKLPSILPIVIGIIAAVAVIAIIIIVICVVISKKGKKDSPVTEFASQVADKAEDVMDNVADKAGDVKDAVVDKAEDIKDAVSDKVDDIKDAVADKADDAKDAAEDAAEEVKEDVEDKIDGDNE